MAESNEKINLFALSDQLNQLKQSIEEELQASTAPSSSCRSRATS